MTLSFVKPEVVSLKTTPEFSERWVQGRICEDPETWVKRFEEAGLTASLRRGNKAARVVTTAKEFGDQKQLFDEFVRAAIASDEGE